MKTKTLIWLFAAFYIPLLILGSMLFILGSLIKGFAYLLWMDLESCKDEIRFIKEISSKFKYL